MFYWLWKLWLDERAQVGGTDDSVEADGATDDTVDAGDAEDEQNSEQANQEPSFVETEGLSDEIRNSAEFKGMQRAFSRKMNRFKDYEQKIAVLDKLTNDPAFYRQFVEDSARKLGMQVVSPNGNQQQQHANGDLESIVKSSLPPEYAEAIPGLSTAVAKAIEAAVGPIKEQTQKSTMEAQSRMLQQDWDRAAIELTEQDPDWEDSSDDIGDLYEFLKSGSMFHPVWGNKLSILHNLVRGEDHAAVTAIDKMRTAARNKTHTSRNGAGQTLSLQDIQERIKSADTSQGKWDTAGKFALEQLKKTGGRA